VTEPMLTLPHYLRPGLRIVFIGYNPAIYSAEAGHYYARPGNAFWKQLSASGIAGRDVGPQDDELLMAEAGIGFTDLCCRPTLRAEELTPDEIIEGSRFLHAELLVNQPAIACFSGRGIYAHFGRHALGVPAVELSGRSYGEQPERVGATIPWVIPSSSGLASKWHRERLEWLHALTAVIKRSEIGPAPARSTTPPVPNRPRRSG
jgi:mismatch-specific thymine-DNA glycosylase